MGVSNTPLFFSHGVRVCYLRFRRVTFFLVPVPFLTLVVFLRTFGIDSRPLSRFQVLLRNENIFNINEMYGPAALCQEIGKKCGENFRTEIGNEVIGSSLIRIR